MPFMTSDELSKVGFAHVGEGVLVSTLTSFYNPQNISIGDFTRIDDYCVLSGGITLQNNTHIAAQSILNAASYKITLKSFAGLAYGCKVFTVSDDYSGLRMTNPTVMPSLRNLEGGSVVIERHAIVGANSIVMPGVTVGEGCAVGALSLVNRSIDPWGIYVGVPVKRLRERRRDLLKLEADFYK